MLLYLVLCTLFITAQGRTDGFNVREEDHPDVEGAPQHNETKREEDHMTDFYDPEHIDDPEHNIDHEAFMGKGMADFYDHQSAEESQKKLGEIFHKVDAQDTEDGFITRDELVKWIESTQRLHLKNESDEHLQMKDTNKDGSINIKEYVNHTYDHSQPQENSTDPVFNQDKEIARDERLFKVADQNGDGELNKDEFYSFNYPENNEFMIPHVVKETIVLADTDKDGHISADEYIKDRYPDAPSHTEGTEEQEWLRDARKRFSETQDKNKDGKLDEAEVKDWLFPDPLVEISLAADHLIKEADTDEDKKISKPEILEKWEVFIGHEKGNLFSSIIEHEEL